MPAVPTIGSVMTAAPITVGPDDRVRTAQKLMSERNIRHLPVMKGGKAVAVVSERDINLALVATRGLAGADDLRVEDVCTLATYTVEVDTPLDEVVLSMAERHIGSVLVLDNGALAGIFTTTDACRQLGRFLREGMGGIRRT